MVGKLPNIKSTDYFHRCGGSIEDIRMIYFFQHGITILICSKGPEEGEYLSSGFCNTLTKGRVGKNICA